MREVIIRLGVQSRASDENYIAGGDDVCGDIDSGTEDVIRVSERLKQAEKEDSQGGSCGRVPSEKTRPRSTPTPSNTPSKIPQATADPNAAFGPPRKWNVSKGSKDEGMTRGENGD